MIRQQTASITAVRATFHISQPSRNEEDKKIERIYKIPLNKIHTPN